MSLTERLSLTVTHRPSHRLDAQTEQNGAPSYMLPDQPADRDHFSELDFEQFFGLLSNEELVIIRPYLGDEDDRMLEELRPKYIVMYDPDPAFVRRVEVSFSLRSDEWILTVMDRHIELRMLDWR